MPLGYWKKEKDKRALNIWNRKDQCGKGESGESKEINPKRRI